MAARGWIRVLHILAWCAWAGSASLESLEKVLEQDSGTIRPWEEFLLLILHRNKHSSDAVRILCEDVDVCVSTEFLRNMGRTCSLGSVESLDWPSSRWRYHISVGFGQATRAALRLMKGVPNVRVVLLQTFKPGENFFLWMKNMFRECWSSSVLDVLIVPLLPGATTRGLVLYTYFPFASGKCHDESPAPVGMWVNGSLVGQFAHLYPTKMDDLQGCTLKLTSEPSMPYSGFIEDEDGTLRLGGFLGTILDVVSKTMNFKPIVQHPLDGIVRGAFNGRRNLSGIWRDLYNNNVDVIVHLSTSVRYMPLFDRPVASQMLCTTWCIPSGLRRHSMWKFLVSEFERLVWFLVLVAYAVGVATAACLARADRRLGGRHSWQSLSDIMFLMLGSTFGSISTLPTSSATRSFFFNWCFYSLVLTTAYQASYNVLSATHRDKENVRNIAEVVEAGLDVFMDASWRAAAKQSQWDTLAERKILDRSQLPHSDTFKSRFLARRDCVFLMTDTFCTYQAKQLGARNEPPPFHVIRNYRLGCTLAHYFAVRKGSPLFGRLSEVSQRMDQAGLSQHLTTLAHSADLDAVPTRAMTFFQLLPFLYMVGAGLGLAAVVFVGELFTGRPRPTRKARHPGRPGRALRTDPSLAGRQRQSQQSPVLHLVWNLASVPGLPGK